MPSITHRFTVSGFLILLLGFSFSAPVSADAAERQAFQQAWAAARKGDHATFNQLGPSLQDYELYPYWQYEYFRYRRAVEPPADMAAFLEQHEDWAFARGLRTAWLKALGERKKWQALREYGSESTNTEVRCYHARARLADGDTDGLMPEAQSLWAVGKSQPDACDPLFSWMRKNNGLTRELAWERIRQAMLTGNPRFTLYLARFLPQKDRVLLENWQSLNRNRYRNLGSARNWSVSPESKMITAMSLKRLAQYDPIRAMKDFDRLEPHFKWEADVSGDVLREIALMAAVDLEPEALDMVPRVPSDHQNQQLLEWWARVALSMQNWPVVEEAVAKMSAETADDSRWRYWQARAWLEQGKTDQSDVALEQLAGETHFHGFLAADHLQKPYTLCPEQPMVEPQDLDQLRNQADFSRSLELHIVELDNWALAEWSQATRRLPVDRLKVAAALARDEGWYDRAIFALGNSGELQFYDWRFPTLYREPVMEDSKRHSLDSSWVFGIMRSESAMTETARSSAGALGLMQVTPATAKQISRKHGLPYRSSSQLLEAEQNIKFGTVYLRELLDDHNQNPVLVSGAYNAGPNAVKKWLNTRPLNETAIWVETLPYYETRDYIPRVLAFTTIYDWRLEQPVTRVSSRMPAIDATKAEPVATTHMVCGS